MTADELIGARIKRRRVECGKTLAEVAGDIGVTPQQIWRYEDGQNPVSVANLFHLSAVLGVSLCWFLADVADADMPLRGEARKKFFGLRGGK